MEISAFADCPKLKAIYVPEGKVDFYKERFPTDMRWLIVEEGDDLPVKGENFIAKDLLFAPSLRMVVSKDEADSDILSAAKKHLDKLSKTEIIEWVIEHLDSITDSQKPYEGV
jgi:hypothetical protein